MTILRKQFDIFGQCGELGVEIWSCPRFVFMVMSSIIILSILATYEIAQRYTEPDFVITLVTLLTIFLLTITQVIVGAFEKVVYGRAREALQAKALIELRDEFVHLAVHDIASSATAIKWGLRTIEPKTKRFAAIEKEVFGNVRDRNERLIELARQILLITRIESGRLVIEKTTIDPLAILSRTLTDFARIVTEKDIKVTYDTPKAFYLQSDAAHLAEIFRILIANALAHTDPAHGTMHISVLESPNEMSVTIENNGEAINEETLPHVFEKFWRKEGKNNTKEIAGKNFGLYIVRSLVEKLGGTITLTSAPTKTAFTVTLPQGHS